MRFSPPTDHTQFNRRSFAAGLLALTSTCAPPSKAFAACSYATFSNLPETLTDVGKIGLKGDFKAAKALLKGEPVLADKAQLSEALDACAAEDGTKSELLKAYAGLEEEFNYQIGKGYDPRWPDAEDVADFQQAVKKLSRPLEKYSASLPKG